MAGAARYALGAPAALRDGAPAAAAAVGECISQWAAAAAAADPLGAAAGSAPRTADYSAVVVHGMTLEVRRPRSFVCVVICGSCESCGSSERCVFTRRAQLASTSLGLLTTESPLRQLCLWIVTSRLFSVAALAVILANSAVLGMVDYGTVTADLAPDAGRSWRNALGDQLDPIFTAIFIAEMCVARARAFVSQCRA